MLRAFAQRYFLRNASTCPTASVTLRPYQEHCLEACTDALGSGATRIGVSLPTGSGKTTVFISLLSRIFPPPMNPAARRSLIIVNSVELARQSASQVAKLFPEWTVEIEQGPKHQASGQADVCVLLVDFACCSTF
jgi:ATP-dependent helicase IRC3